MRILALDLSSKSSGWAVFEDTTYIASGCITASSVDVVKRITKITKEIDKILTQYQIDKVIMEEVLPTIGHNSNTNVWKALTWLQAAVVLLLHESYPKTEKEFIMPNSWRAKIGIHTGAGVKRENLKQADMNFVKKNYGLDVGDDESDAICIGHAYVYQLNNEINWE